jgi:hypothetical protein
MYKMNHTLAQLAHEAGITVTAESAKFAEMIIRECADIADTHDCNLSLNGDSIRTHFGVEL